MIGRDEILRGPDLFLHGTAVSFADCVGGGRAYHPKLLARVHEAYEAFLVERATPLPEVLRARAWAAPLTRATLEVMGDVRHGARLAVALTATAMRKNRVAFGWRARDVATGAVVAFATTVHAFVDARSFKGIDVPEDLATFVAAKKQPTGGGEAPARLPGPRGESPLLSAPSLHARRTTVELADVDAAGVMYFARTPALFHEAYCDLRRSRHEPMGEYVSAGFEMLASDVEYRAPVRAGEIVDVHVVSSEVHGTRTEVGFRMTTAKSDVVAIGTYRQILSARSIG